MEGSQCETRIDIELGTHFELVLLSSKDARRVAGKLA